MDHLSDHLCFAITANGPVSAEIVRSGFHEFRAVAERVRAIPYGRPANPTDVLSVFRENVGTCSSKHRLLAATAHECGHREVDLIVGVYEMAEDNTPGVGPILSLVTLRSIPEAHCYLRIAGCRHDFTGLPSGRSSPFDSLLSEEAVLPEDLPVAKIAIHEKAMASWALRHGVPLSRAWRIREACIEALATNNR